MNSALLVIDLQNSFKDKTCEMYDKVLNFIKYVDNYDYYIGTVFVNEDIYGIYKNKLDYKVVRKAHSFRGGMDSTFIL